MKSNDITVFYEATPNPQSMKFIATVPMASESIQFTDASQARRSPLALKIFGFPWSAGVFIGPNFVTITKQEWVDWDILADPLAELIKEHLAGPEPVLLAVTDGASTEMIGGDDILDSDSEVVKRIKQILRDEIRPAVAMDGGDVRFDSYEASTGRVYLAMQGACSGCPSASYTLKEGIEKRLLQAIPELQEVIAV